MTTILADLLHMRLSLVGIEQCEASCDDPPTTWIYIVTWHRYRSQYGPRAFGSKETAIAFVEGEMRPDEHGKWRWNGDANGFIHTQDRHGDNVAQYSLELVELRP